MNSQIKGKEVLVLSTAMLSFISFWRAAAVVLCDMGSSAYYAGSIAMNAFGPAAPWYVLAVMVFGGLMLAVYVESCAMFVRGGVYKVVNEALGHSMAKVSVSALIFDYMITGPISSISAGLYVSGLLTNLLPLVHVNWQVPPKVFAVVFAVLVTAYFWKENIKGVEESSDKNFKIMGFVTVVGAILMVWSLVTVGLRGFTLPPFELKFTHDALGWMNHFPVWQTVGLIGIVMAFGHSILAMSGLETLAQVYREIEDPKIKNLKRAAWAVFLFSFVFTGGLTFLSSLIIPGDLIAGKYADNLLSGLALELSGPYWARLVLQTLVVVSGSLMLVGALNTSLVGANGVLNRVAEDGILHDWFRQLHKKYGTTYRMINVIALAQIGVIILSRGDIYLIGEAYAFGVLWSLVFKTLSLIILRFKDHTPREWMFPLNFRIGRAYFPAGMVLVFIVLLGASLANLLTKRVATIAGLVSTAALYAVFQVSENLTRKKAQLYAHAENADEKMNLRRESDIGALLPELTKPGRILVPVRNPNNLAHLKRVLETVDDATTEIIVLSAKIAKGLQSAGDAAAITEEDRELFTPIILLAEKYGKTIKPLLVVSNDPFYSIVHTAQAVGAAEIVLGVSGSTGAEVQLERLAMTWGLLKQKQAVKPTTARVIWEGRELTYKLT
ncbi:MAG TPA: APC family permease [Elusimicrobia bacterium]|nr:APC family permease [Elusimicrobiota bacterium]